LSRDHAVDAAHYLAKISAVNEAAFSRNFFGTVGKTGALLSIIGLVLIGDIVARCGPLT